MLIDTDTFPTTMKAVHLIQADSGDRLAIPLLTVPDRWNEFLPDIEQALGTLSQTKRAPEEEPLPPHIKPDQYLDSEFYSFCNGEHLAQTKIANRSMELVLALAFLDDFFEGWTLTTEEHSNNPLNYARQRRIEFLDNTPDQTNLQRDELEALRLKLT